MEGSEAGREVGMVVEGIVAVLGEAGKEWEKVLVLPVEWSGPLASGSCWSVAGDWHQGCLELESVPRRIVEAGHWGPPQECPAKADSRPLADRI